MAIKEQRVIFVITPAPGAERGFNFRAEFHPQLKKYDQAMADGMPPYQIEMQNIAAGIGAHVLGVLREEQEQMAKAELPDVEAPDAVPGSPVVATNQRSTLHDGTHAGKRAAIVALTQEGCVRFLPEEKIISEDGKEQFKLTGVLEDGGL